MVTNACSCPSCKEYIQDGEYINSWTEDEQSHICGRCKMTYSPDQSLDAEYSKQKYGNMTAINILQNKLIKYGDLENLTISWEQLGKILAEVKQLERWQIVDAFTLSRSLICNGEQYYETHFKDINKKSAKNL